MKTAMTVAAAAVLVLAGCSQAPAPVTDTREADAKAIRDGEEAWNRDWAAKDVDKIASHYTDDANWYLPNTPLLTGKSAMLPVLKQILMDPNVTLTFTALQVEVSKSGDLAYSHGAYRFTITDSKTKKPVVEKGKYITIYRKTADGTWKVTQDINSADAPAVPLS